MIAKQLTENKKKLCLCMRLYVGGDKWEASLLNRGSRQYLGCFDSAEEAARAHDIEARKCLGDAASTNFRYTTGCVIDFDWLID
jgi:hypothetical protein